jgi:hypothetical protein
VVRVRLTRKFAQIINGIDLTSVAAGEQIDLTPREAELLVAEGWAMPVGSADDRPRRRLSRRKKKGKPAIG